LCFLKKYTGIRLNSWLLSLNCYSRFLGVIHKWHYCFRRRADSNNMWLFMGLNHITKWHIGREDRGVGCQSITSHFFKNFEQLFQVWPFLNLSKCHFFKIKMSRHTGEGSVPWCQCRYISHWGGAEVLNQTKKCNLLFKWSLTSSINDHSKNTFWCAHFF